MSEYSFVWIPKVNPHRDCLLQMRILLQG